MDDLFYAKDVLKNQALPLPPSGLAPVHPTEIKMVRVAMTSLESLWTIVHCQVTPGRPCFDPFSPRDPCLSGDRSRAYDLAPHVTDGLFGGYFVAVPSFNLCSPAMVSEIGARLREPPFYPLPLRCIFFFSAPPRRQPRPSFPLHLFFRRSEKCCVWPPLRRFLIGSLLDVLSF